MWAQPSQTSWPGVIRVLCLDVASLRRKLGG